MFFVYPGNVNSALSGWVFALTAETSFSRCNMGFYKFLKTLPSLDGCFSNVYRSLRRIYYYISLSTLLAHKQRDILLSSWKICEAGGEKLNFCFEVGKIHDSPGYNICPPYVSRHISQVPQQTKEHIIPNIQLCFWKTQSSSV